MSQTSSPAEVTGSRKQIIVLITCYNGRQFIDDCLPSLLESCDPGIDSRVVVVDNASTDGSGAYIREHFPQVDCLDLQVNRGFAGGHNFGWAHICQTYPDAPYVILLNIDTVVRSGWLTPLVRFLDNNPQVAAVQPKLMLHEQPDVINTVGNRSHYLGFGMMTGYGEPDSGQYDQPRMIDFASGAAVMLRCDLVRQVGLFDETFYMYLEDADLCWKLRQMGHEIWYVPDSVVYHKYVPNAPLKYYCYLERNRWLLLLTYYRWRTLVLLCPALGLMELGQLGYAMINRRLCDKMRSIWYFLSFTNLCHIHSRRQSAKRRRTVSDRSWMGQFTDRIELPVATPVFFLWFGNFVFATYWRVAQWLLRW